MKPELKELTPELLEFVVEVLAKLEHEQWAHWMKFLDSQKKGCDPVVFKHKWKRWMKQADTPYLLLSEKEKESDRVWARRVLDALGLPTSKQEGL